MMNFIRNIIRRGAVTDSGKDDKFYPQQKIESNSSAVFIEPLYPYGSYGSAPNGSIVTVMQQNGDEESLAGIAYHRPTLPRSMKAGEVAHGNFYRDSYIKWNDNGSATLKISGVDVAVFESDKMTVNVPVLMKSTLDVEDTANFTTDINSNGKNIGDTHKHSGVQSGAATSGPVA